MQIRPLSAHDIGAVFTLQRASFVDEARLYDTPFVPALDETLDELRERLDQSTSWVAEDNSRIVGAVSLRLYRNGIPDVERLMVAPDCRGTGVSSVLMRAAEGHARSQGHEQLQLIVGDLATTNRSIYAYLGWVEGPAVPLAGFEHVLIRTMTKALT